MAYRVYHGWCVPTCEWLATTDPLEAHHLLAAGAMSLAVKKNEDLLEDFGMIVNLFVILLNIINHLLKIYFSWNRNCRNWRPFLNFVN